MKSMRIGIAIGIKEASAPCGGPRYPEVRERVCQAEQAGFDSIWLCDHLLYRSPGQPTLGIWECWTILSALAEATRRIELGTLVICNAFRNPALLAKMAATLDEVNNGRFILGLGAGWNKAEFDAFGVPFDRRVSRFKEALQIISPLLRAGRVDFAGEYYQARDCEIAPRGPRPGRPPLLVGASSPRMLRLAAQYADLWNSNYVRHPSLLDEPRRQLDAACREIGRDPAALRPTALVPVAFPELGALGIAKLGRPLNANEYVSGSVDDIAAALDNFAQSGVAHLIVHLAPYNDAAFSRLAEVLRVYRQMAGAS